MGDDSVALSKACVLEYVVTFLLDSPDSAQSVTLRAAAAVVAGDAAVQVYAVSAPDGPWEPTTQSAVESGFYRTMKPSPVRGFV